MENIKKINVALFGGKSVFKNVKDNPLRAETIYCECPEKCPIYSRGMCVLHGLLFNGIPCEVKMKVPDDYKVEVLDNDWVNENTVFV